VTDTLKDLDAIIKVLEGPGGWGIAAVTLRAVREELVSLEREAKRYRWLRRNLSGRSWREVGIEYSEPSQIETLIDAARAEVEMLKRR